MRTEKYFLQNCVFVLLLFISQTVFPAETSQSSEVLLIDQLVDLVLQNNPRHFELDAAISEARALVLPAGSLADPQLSYSIAPATIIGNSSNRFRQAIELSQTIPWPGSLALRERQATNMADMAYYHLKDHDLDVIMSIKMAFAEYYYIHHALEINKKNLTLLTELKQIIEAQYISGQSKQQDVLRAELEYGQLNQQSFELVQVYASIRAQINALLNREPQRSLPPPADLGTLIKPEDTETLQALALENHPQLLSLKANLDATKAAIGLAEKNYYPDIKIQTGYNNMWDDTDMRFMIGAEINLPIGQSKRDSQLDAAEAASMQAHWKLIDQRSLLLSRVEQSRLQVTESIQNIEIYEQKLLPLARENYAIAIADYRTGTGLFTNVSDAETSLLSIELRLLRSRADYFRRYAELDRWIGKSPDNNHRALLP